MEHRCSRCDALIPRQAKGYKRKSLLSLTDLKTARRLFPDLDPAQAFLCFSCVRLVYQRTKRSGKKRVYVDPQAAPRRASTARPPEDPPPPKKLKQRLKAALNEHDYASTNPEPTTRTEPPPTRRVRRGPIPQICGYLQKKNLRSALNLLLQVSGFKEALIRTCSKVINKERQSLVNDPDGPFRKTFSPSSLAAFSWDQTTSWAEQRAPLTVACLRSMFPPCVLLAVPLYTSSLQACFVQTALSVEMLRRCCPAKLFNILNGLGLSQCQTTARVHAKKLAAKHQQQVALWREVQVPSVSTDQGYTFQTWAFRFAHRARVNFPYLHGAALKAVEVSPCGVLPNRQVKPVGSEKPPRWSSEGERKLLNVCWTCCLLDVC